MVTPLARIILNPRCLSRHWGQMLGGASRCRTNKSKESVCVERTCVELACGRTANFGTKKEKKNYAALPKGQGIKKRHRENCKGEGTYIHLELLNIYIYSTLRTSPNVLI